MKKIARKYESMLNVSEAARSRLQKKLASLEERSKQKDEAISELTEKVKSLEEERDRYANWPHYDEVGNDYDVTELVDKKELVDKNASAAIENETLKSSLSKKTRQIDEIQDKNAALNRRVSELQHRLLLNREEQHYRGEDLAAAIMPIFTIRDENCGGKFLNLFEI